MKRGSILLVEDHPETQRVISLLLEQEGFIVIPVNNALKAIQVLPIFKLDVIIVDLLMPQLPGLPFIRYVRRLPKFAHTPILAMTAYGPEYGADYLRHARNAGATATLFKPEGFDQLSETVHSLIETTSPPVPEKNSFLRFLTRVGKKERRA